MHDKIHKAMMLITLIIGAPLITFIFLILNFQEKSYSFQDSTIDISIAEDKTCIVDEHFIVENINAGSTVKRYLPFYTWVKKPDGSWGSYRLLDSEFTCLLPKNVQGISRFFYDFPAQIVSTEIPQTDKVEAHLRYSATLTSQWEAEDNQLFFNITGNKHRVSLYGVSFSIEMPSRISKDNVKFYILQKNRELKPADISFQLVGNTIKGRYDKEIEPGTGLVVMMDLEDGYFQIVREEKNYIPIWGGIMFIFLICFVFWFLGGKEKYTVIDTVEFDTPFGMSPTELGYFYSGFGNRESTIAMFFSLAGKGYIQIIESKKRLSKKTVYHFYKVRDYDGDNVFEETFMRIMFENTTVISSKDLKGMASGLLSKDMEDYHYAAHDFLAAHYPLYYPGIGLLKLFFFLCVFATYILAFALTCVEPMSVTRHDFVLLRVLETLFLFPFIFVTLIFAGQRRKTSSLNTITTYFGFGIGVGILWVPSLIWDKMHILTYLMGSIAIAAEIWFMYHSNKLTADAAKIKGHVMGYRKFLQHVESNRIDTLFETNKLQYYEVAANAYALNVNWKWFKDLEDVLLPTKDPDEI